MMNQTIIGLYMFLVGAYATFRKQKKIFFILLSPLLLTLIASSFRKYPFESRLILFYFPFLYLFITEGVIFFTDARSFYPKILGFILIVLIVCPALIVSYIELFHGVFYPDEIKPILNYVRMNRQKEDTIYVYYGAERAFQYYADTYGFENGSYIIGKNFKENWEQYRTDIDQLKGKTRVWIIFTHVYFDQERSEEKYIVDYMESIGKRLDSFHAVRASVYLYDFTNSPQI